MRKTKIICTVGPEYRIKSFRDGKTPLNDGDKFAFTTDKITGDETRVRANYKVLINNLEVGDTLLGLENGDNIIITGGTIDCHSGQTDTLRLHRIAQ